jgi:hypothetical protein
MKRKKSDNQRLLKGRSVCGFDGMQKNKALKTVFSGLLSHFLMDLWSIKS